MTGTDAVRYRFTKNNQPRGEIPIDTGIDGTLQAVVWIPDRRDPQRPIGVAIGTSSGNILVFRTTDRGDARTMRRFRGHSGAVTSLAVSRDLRYLASASQDHTVRIWPLAGMEQRDAELHRWGATFETVGGQLEVATIREDGPLYFRGLRVGDRIRKLMWVDRDGRTQAADTAETIAQALRVVDDNRLVVFESIRGRQRPRRFQIVPYWQQLASLFVDGRGEWAYWAPDGYYDASFEGHKLFGWQINRGLAMLPDFFPAAAFRKILERPAVMSKILEAGSVAAAFRLAHLEPPADVVHPVALAYRLKPAVKIESPSAAASIEGGVATVRAAITFAAGQRIVPPKAFANGIVAPRRKLVARTFEDDRHRLTYEWEMPLPSDPEILLQVFAATDEEVTASDSIAVTQPPRKPSREPRLFLLTAGVDRYRDAQIPRLTTAVQSTVDLTAVIRDRAQSLYRIETDSLRGPGVSKPAFRYMTRQYAADLARNVSPDDLLVIYLSGHGVQSPQTGEYYYVTADADYADVLAGDLDDCLAFSDLAVFAAVPCRKVVVLDTCHGGAIEPLAQRELKAAVRFLQDDLLLTLTASAGDQEAIEGRFAGRLLEALAGAADREDGNHDGVSSFSEVVAYVQRTVAGDSLADPVTQLPTAGPRELLPYVAFPITRDRQSAPLSAARVLRPLNNGG